jgi:hypothetical protein
MLLRIARFFESALVVLLKRADGCVEVMCSRCLHQATAVTADELVAAGWELRADRQTSCLECSAIARVPKGMPNDRGIVKRRRRR